MEYVCPSEIGLSDYCADACENCWKKAVEDSRKEAIDDFAEKICAYMEENECVCIDDILALAKEAKEETHG